MLKRVKRKTSKQQSLDKSEEIVTPEKKENSPNTELLTQVIQDLKNEVKSLKEQLEKEKKNTSELKSLKTQQVCTLTFKLASSVRQREKAEEELGKLQKEMEGLKEVIQQQEERLNAAEESKGENQSDQQENAAQRQGEETTEIKVQEQVENADDKEIDSTCQRADENDLEPSSILADKDGAPETTTTTTIYVYPEGTEQITIDILYPELEPEIDSPYQKKDENDIESSLIPGDKNESLEQRERVLEPLTESGLEEGLSKQEQRHDVFQAENVQNSPSEARNPDESPECKEAIRQEFTKIQTEMHEVKESVTAVQKMNHHLAEDLKNFAKKQQKIFERKGPVSSRKNRLLRAENREDAEHKFSPPSSPEEVLSSGYASIGNGLDEELTTFARYLGISDDQDDVTAKPEYSGVKVHEKHCTNEYENETYSRNSMVTERYSAYEKMSKEESRARKTASEESDVDAQSITGRLEALIRKRDQDCSESTSLNVSEDVKDLKHQLETAMREIQELRFENKEMKREMRKLSTSAEKETFFLKTAKSTDQLLRETKGKEDEEQVYTRRHSLGESQSARCALNSGLGQFSQSENAPTSMRRWDETHRSRKTSLPLKLIGARLKEITKSVENMAMNTEVEEETLLRECAEGLMDYERNDDIGLEPFMNPTVVSLDRGSAYKDETFRACAGGEAPESRELARVYMAGEKLGEERFCSTRSQQLMKKEYAQQEDQFKPADHTPEPRSVISGYRPWKSFSSDTRDNVQRYVVRSSAHIANMRDLKPGELAFLSKTS